MFKISIQSMRQVCILAVRTYVAEITYVVGIFINGRTVCGRSIQVFTSVAAILGILYMYVAGIFRYLRVELAYLGMYACSWNIKIGTIRV
jgi:hypothetical protein